MLAIILTWIALLRLYAAMSAYLRLNSTSAELSELVKHAVLYKTSRCFTTKINHQL